MCVGISCKRLNYLNVITYIYAYRPLWLFIVLRPHGLKQVSLICEVGLCHALIALIRTLIKTSLQLTAACKGASLSKRLPEDVL